jgi:Ca-activated chloride channel family protein
MTFAWPHLLWLLLVPAALFGWELTRQRRSASRAHPKILRAEAGAQSLRLLNPDSPASTGAGRGLRPWLALGLLFAIVAFARPQWGRLEEPVFDQSREILLAIDLSRSMLTPDVRPSRLERAKLLTQSLLEKLAGERVGLVVFSGTAFLQCPLSSDYEILREFLPALNPGYMPEGGTNYGALIDTAIGAFGSGTAADRFLVILSDGEATDDDWRDRAQELKKKGIRVISLGVGTAAGAMIPDGTGGLVKDDRGAVVLSKLESGTLRELAEFTGGAYRDASTWLDLASVLNATVEAGRKGQFVEKNTVRLVERFQWPLALALWFLLVSLYYEFPVRPRPRAIRLSAAAGRAAPAASVAATAALLLLLLAASVPPGRAADDTGPAVGKVFARLAAKDELSAQDYAEIAHETLRWGQRLRENGQPVKPDPVHDAIQAVDKLKAIDSRISDWNKLRADLEALLEKPDEQKKDQPDQSQKNQDEKDQDKKDQQKQDQSKPDSKSSQDQQSKDRQSPPEKKDQQSEDQQSKSGKPEDQKKPESAFGDMKDREPPPPPKPQPGETQKVGGVPEKKDAAESKDPLMAVPLQKLDQLRNQDSPAELFQLMDADKKTAAPRKKSKDW